MRIWKLPILLATLALGAVALCLPAAASAAFEHVIAPGESLSSVAAADGLSVGQLADANGLSPDAQLTLGASLSIPPQGAGSGAAGQAAAGPSTGSSSTGIAPSAAGGSAGGYLVHPGDTLSAIAARYGVSVDGLAAANGLDPAGILPAGDTLSVAGSSGGSSGSSGGSTSGASSDSVQPTTESVSPSDVGTIAAQDGVSPSLAMAIADQESGFNNNEVSNTGATGVMQIEPGTWADISRLTGSTLATDSATDNVRGGVMLLHSLLDQTGGDPALAAAAYYQGLTSVRRHGMYADTQRYVNNVMALRDRFGG